MNATSGSNGNGLHLEGTGGAYLHVSGDRQDTERQYADLGAFEEKYGVKVAPQHRYEDEMPRDLSDLRPDFQRMLKAARAGILRWVWVQRIDRFGVEDGDELVALRRELRKAGCRLVDSSGTDWTNRDLLTLIRAGLAGEQSRGEQVEKSFRALDGMVKKARAGEWMGGPPRLGFDVGCFDRSTGVELWRVVWEGREKVGIVKRKGKMRPDYRIRRRKVYPDGRTERFDGSVVFRTSDTQVLRITPTHDKAKLDAAADLFRRYATESISFCGLAKWLNELGIANAFGECWQGRDIEPMLSDAVYLGYVTFNKQRAGRFHRYSNGAIEQLPPELYRTYTASESTDVIRSTRPDGQRWFEPLVERAVWDAVQRKLGGREKSPPSPRSGGLYLSGLLVCAGCGQLMYARKDRGEYFCGTYHKHRCEGTLDKSPCNRNAIAHSVLEEYVNRYLEETGKRLDILMQAPDGGHLTDKLEGQADDTWQAFTDGMTRLCEYLAQHHPYEYNALLEDARHVPNAEREDNTYRPSQPGSLASVAQRALAEGLLDQAPPPPALPPNDFVRQCVATYRNVFDHAGIAAEMERLEAEHTALMHRYADLPTPRARDKAKAELGALEDRIAALEGQQHDVADVIEGHYRRLTDLQGAIYSAKEAMRSDAGVQALRRRAEALRGLLVEIRCEFVATGKGMGKQPGPGEARSRLSTITFMPIAGEVRRYPAASGGGSGDGGGGNSRVTGGRNAVPNAGPARNPLPALSQTCSRERRAPTGKEKNVASEWSSQGIC